MVFRKCIFLFQLSFSLITGFLTITCQKKTTTVHRKIDAIFFLSNRDVAAREFDLFSMNRDGGEQTNLTRHIPGIRTFSNPIVSHDGTTVLFVTLHQLERTIHVLQSGDSISTPLTQVQVDQPQPRFAPDDRSIIFTDKVDGRNQIFRMNRDGSNRQNLSQNKFDETEPEFSPDGSKICFTTRRGKTSSIGLMNSDGSEQELLTDDAGNDADHSFSPDGSKITFCSDRSGTSDIYYLKISNKKIVELCSEKSHDIEPQFSPDGKYVLFISNARGMKFRDLMLIHLKSKQVKNLTPNLNHFNQNPVFVPDGRSILFESIRFEDAEIYEIGIDGQNLKNLTNHPRWDLAPAL